MSLGISIITIILAFLVSVLKQDTNIKILSKEFSYNFVKTTLLIFLMSVNIVDVFIKDSKEKTIAELEKAKIIYQEPKLEVFMPRLVKDTFGIHYKFSFINYGKRDADSVIYKSMMVMVDKKLSNTKLALYKSNINYQNVLKIPPDLNVLHYFNSPAILESLIDEFDIGFLLVKYTYVDNFTNNRKNPQLSIFVCNLKKYSAQMSPSIENNDIELIKKRLFVINKTDYYYFFGQD